MKIKDNIEQSITRTYRFAIWSRFVKALKDFSLLKENDKVILILNNDKCTLLLAKLFKTLLKHSDFEFTIKYIILNKNDSLLINNAELLNIDYEIIENFIDYKDYNVLIDINNYDDVINKTLLNILYNGKYETIVPKYKKEDIRIINPLYFIRIKDINNWVNFNNLHVLEKKKTEEEIYIEKLINDLLKYNEFSEMNIFKSAFNVNIDKVLGYKIDNNHYSFLSYYEKNKL